MTRRTPSLQKRLLIMALKDARERAGYTQREVATALEWSPSKLLRMENGQVNIGVTDLHALLSQYGVKDRREVDALAEMARDARRPSPFSTYRAALSEAFLTYLEFESSALRIRTFEPLLIPGLLQTPDYAESVVRKYSSADTEESVIQQRVEARLRRQDLFDAPDSPEFYFIIDEAALRRMVGVEADGAGQATMPGQLEHLKKMNRRDNVRIQVVRFNAGAHRGLTGSFFHLEFPSEIPLPDIVYLENARGDAVSYENSADTSQHLTTFFDLEDIATHESHLDGILDEIIEEQLKSVAARPVAAEPTGDK